MRKQSGIASVSERPLAEMVCEAERVSPDETRGALVGYWAEPHREAVITDVTGPGPNALHLPHNFLPGDEYQESEIARLYHASGRLHTHLGDWHTHLRSSADLSRLDRRTLRKVATHPEARAPVPLMAVLGGGPEWTLKVWKYVPTWPGGYGLWIKTTSLRLRIRPLAKVVSRG